MKDYDLIVIGGGIHGAGVAQAAAAAGYQVLILEQDNWAAGTSSRSSKLIHGGLRYLQSGQFQLVWECLRERELLLKNAPELVSRTDFYIPVYQQSKYHGWQIGVGLFLYGLLAGFRPGCRFALLPKDEFAMLAPLTELGLKSVFRYQDAQTDDRQLTHSIIQSARSLGATARCPARFVKAEQNVAGYSVHYIQDNREQEADCRCLVNAAGPWVNKVAQLITPAPQQLEIDLVQGSHLLLAGSLGSHCYYLESPRDQRAVFALPWYGNTLVGTTETLFQGAPEDVKPLAEEEVYLTETINHYFPKAPVEIIDRFAGLRVLPRNDRRFFNRSRETRICVDNRVISLYGGKLTSYRATAEKVVKQIKKIVGKRPRIASTKTLKLSPVPVADAASPANGDNAG